MTQISLNEIKKELKELEIPALQALCLRLAKYRKENKELLAYLLFFAHDEPGYVKNVKDEIDLLFSELSGRNLYITKKMLRKILRATNKHIRYSGLHQTELDLRIYFCGKVKSAGVPLASGTVLFNLYQQQLKKIAGVLNKLPEDFQADYSSAFNSLQT